jgi:hypothetical protein
MKNSKICWIDLNLPPINLWNLPMTNIKYKSKCPNCNRDREYKTKQGYEKGLNKACRSCANSISRGGTGFTEFCSCGNPKYSKSSTLCYNCHLKRSSSYHTQTYRFKKYGVDRDWYEQEVLKGCKICGKNLLPYSKDKTERGHIDHCHTTGKVRGVLCDLCNKGLGQFKDNIETLEKAINYLKENK